MLQQDLHIHTTYSKSDDSVVPEQTVALVAAVRHAAVVGISDHFECLVNGDYERYEKEIRRAGLKVGIAVDGHPWADEAAKTNVDYYIFHCRDLKADCRSLEKLLTTGKPVIVAHPNALFTDLRRVPSECLIEINNRYIWRDGWRRYFGPFANRFRFVIGSDAHQPNWLSQAVAQYAAGPPGREHLLPGMRAAAHRTKPCPDRAVPHAGKPVRRLRPADSRLLLKSRPQQASRG